MQEKLAFEIPAAFASGLADGTLSRVGALIKETASGKIVAHVQESGVGQELLGGLVRSIFDPAALVETAASLGANVQLAQLKKMVGSLQVLQYANLGGAIVGVGATVAGFVVINRKLQSIEGTIEQLGRRMDQQFQFLHEDLVRQTLASIRGQLERLEAARKLRDPQGEFHNVAASLTESSAQLRERISSQVDHRWLNDEVFAMLTRTLLMSDSSRIEAYLLAEEMETAHHCAISIGDAYTALFDGIAPTKLDRCRGTAEEGPRHMTSKQIVQTLRDITDSALTRPFLIESLHRREISGRDYLETLRAEREEPILLLREP